MNLIKFAKMIASIIIAVTLLGCGIFKSQDPIANLQATAQSDSTAQGPTAPINPTPLNVVSFRWIGVDQDIVAPNEVKPDAKLDGHFHITVPFGQTAVVKSIWIRYSEFGKSLKWGWIYNKNLPLNGYLIAALDNGGKTILPQGDNGYRVDGLTDFDLYLSELDNVDGRDTFKFEQGQTFDLEINYITQDNEERVFKSSETIK